VPDEKPSVLCAGILVADIFVPPVPALPGAGELRATEDFLIDSGGCAANTATCLAKLGVPTMVAGRVGSDLFGEFIARDLSGKGIDTTGLKRSTAQGTSKTVVLTVAGEDRRFIHTFGANAEFRVEDIAPALLSRAKLLYVGGYLVLPSVEQAQLAALFRSAREQGVRTVLDVVVAAGDTSLSMDALRGVLPFVDFFVPNDEEARVLTGETEARRQAECFLAAGCGTAVVTMGHHGTLLMNAQETLQAPVYPVEVVDGAGAGDAFAAGFTVGILEGWSMPETIRFASAIGASACTRLGCTTGVFDRPQAEAFLRSRPLEIRVQARPRQ
jgi:sugar/nucleoside kinase (ribokinase family)